MTLSAFPGSVLAGSLAESDGEVLALLEAGLEEGGRDGSAVLTCSRSWVGLHGAFAVPSQPVQHMENEASFQG